MLKIRLMRIGGRQRPFYRVVAVDERAKRTGGYIELLGTYNPLTEPKEIKLKQDRIDHWVKQGAQMSTGFLRIIGKAPQRPPRKPKKEKKVEEKPQPGAGQPVAEKAEEKATEVPATEEIKPAADEPKTEETTPVAEEKVEEAPKEEIAPVEEKPAEEEKKDEGTA